MTPFRNDEANPFAPDRIWPGMPQAPLRLGPLPSASAAPTEERPFAPPSRPTSVRLRRRLRMTPLLGAAVVGAAGRLTLFLLIGHPPPR